MVRKISAGIIAFALLLESCKQPGRTPASFVNPFLGTGGHGHTYPGASMPFGMIQISPDTRLEGWDGCSAYHSSDSVIYGFSHTHLSGTGCSDYGDILIMPVKGNCGLQDYQYKSGFSKKTELARPGYYEVQLDKPGVKVSVAAGFRAGIHRYEFSDPSQAGVVIDLKHRDLVLDSRLKISSEDEIEGMRISRGWASQQVLYFAARFSSPISAHMFQTGEQSTTEGKEASGKEIKARLSFNLRQGEPLLMKIGISAVSAENARQNLEHEITGWDLERLAFKADSCWNSQLGKISIEGGSRDQKTIFYTALYHAMLNPNLYSDSDSSYRGRDLLIHKAEGFDYYTVFSLWDTYRAEHPLLTILDQKRTTDFINTFLKQYEQGGALPVWELSANETGCMIGYHAVPVIVDAYLKGIRGFDAELALKAMKSSAENNRLGLLYYNSMGYIPSDLEGESVSKTLEYAYDDWCIAMMARSMGRNDDYSRYIKRAQYYKNVYDRSTGFMRAKANSTWFSPFDPAEVNFNYTEANAWQYSFYVPQDISGLTELSGGREKFAVRLDSLFSVSSKTTGREQADITGLIGQYAHGNEPSHHMAYLYNYVGQPWKTQKLVSRICKEFYRNDPDGLCGNEDCGQMSAWYVFSALGFYPVLPGSGEYAIGTPMFPKMTIRLENGKTFTIEAENVSEKNCYIAGASLNGKPYNRCFIRHQDIMEGGVLQLTMSSKPEETWGSKKEDLPSSQISDHLITPVPSVLGSRKTFLDTTLITLSCPLPSARIYYTLDGTSPGAGSEVYSRPFVIDKSTRLRAFAAAGDMERSFEIEANFIRIPKDRRINLLTNYSGQYSAGGNLALIDFIRGGENFKTGTWQGYEGVDLDAVVDLGKVQPIRKISLGCLQDEASWIFMPYEVRVSLSDDNKQFVALPAVRNTVSEKTSGPMIKDFTVNASGRKARYIRVQAVNRVTCPEGHPGAGRKAWIFADEIVIE